MPPDPRLIQSDGDAVMGTALMLLRSAIASGVRVVVVSRLGSPDAVVDLVESHSAWLAEQGVEALVLPDAALAASAARGALDAGRSGLLLLDAQGAADAGRALLPEPGEAIESNDGGVVVAVGPWDSALGRAVADAWSAGGMTVFEPAHHGEVMPWFGMAMRASASAGGVAVLGLAGALWDVLGRCIAASRAEPAIRRGSRWSADPRGAIGSMC